MVIIKLLPIQDVKGGCAHHPTVQLCSILCSSVACSLSHITMSEEDLLLSSACCLIIDLLSKKRHKKRRFWERTLFKRRNLYSGTNLLTDFRMEDSSGFKNFCRMSAADFEYLLTVIGPKISKRDTNCRSAVPVRDRLAITLRFLATGDSYTSLMYLFKVSKQLISAIVPEVCTALITELQEYIQARNA